MSALLLVAVLLPLALAPFAALPLPGRRLALRLAPWAALPALGLAVAAPASGEIHLPWLLLGARVGLDLTGRVFLLFTALLWTAAGVYARSYVGAEEGRARYFAFHLLTLAGNLGLTVALDLVGFYLFFALMTFSAYGLIVHGGGSEARRAGRVYIALAVVGESMLLAGAVLAAASAEGLALREVSAGLAASPHRELATGLLFLGFAVKAGIFPLHVWLPLAHPVAPTPASAVLSGSMIKAGLLGWIRLLPLGVVAVPEWGAAVIVLGLATAVLGVLAGVAQEDPKTILAYSSVSQMGIMSTAVGAALLSPALAPVALGALLAYAAHHGLVKGALFLGVGVAAARAGRGRPLVVAGLAFAALAMAGAPLTSGSVAKHYLKEVGHGAPGAWAYRLDLVLPLTAVGTTLLMARFLTRTLADAGEDERRPLPAGMWAPWLVLLGAVAGVLWILPRRVPLGVEAPGLPGGADLWASLWPIAAGVALSAGVARTARRGWIDPGRLRVPPGDVLEPVLRSAAPLRNLAGRVGAIRAAEPVTRLAAHWYGVYAERTGWSGLVRAELRLSSWSSAAILVLLVLLGLLGSVFLGGEVEP